jgi:hypothetical protein
MDDEEIPDINPKRTYLQLVEVTVEGDKIVKQIPKFGVLDPELFSAFLSLCEKFEKKYPDGSCTITPEDISKQEEKQNEQDLSRILDLVELESGETK